MRNPALALWLLASGCGSDDDAPGPGNDSGLPVDSGVVNDAASPADSAIPDSAIADSGAADAGGGDSGAPDGGGGSDAGNPELAEALKTEEVVVTMRRVELVLQAFCHAYAVCTTGVSETDCVTSNTADWTDPSIYQPTDADRPCNDAKLDVASCAAVTPCDQLDSCTPFQDKEDMLCGEEDGGM